MRNGILNKKFFKNKIIAGILVGLFSLQAFGADKIQIPLPESLTRFMESNSNSNLELVIEIDRMESKQDQALAGLFKKTQSLTESQTLSQSDFISLETEFYNDLQQQIAVHKHPFISIEGERLFADFVLRLSLASMPNADLAAYFANKASQHLNSVFEQLEKRGPSWVERELPQVLSRMTVTQLSLLNVQRLLNSNMKLPEFFASSRAIKERILDFKPSTLSEAEILSAHMESILFAQHSEPFAPYNTLYMSEVEQKNFQETKLRMETLESALKQQKSGGIRRLLALEKLRTILNIASFYLVSPAKVARALEDLQSQMNSNVPLHRRAAVDAATYLYSINEMTGLSRPLAILLGKEKEFQTLLSTYEQEFKNSLGHEFFSKLQWPSFVQIFEKLNPQNSRQGHQTTSYIQNYLASILNISKLFIAYKNNSKLVTGEHLDKAMTDSDRSWAQLQCAFVYHGIDTHRGQLDLRSPLRKTKFKLQACRDSAYEQISARAYGIVIEQITREKNREITLLAAGLTLDVALAIVTVGSANVLKKGLQSLSVGVFKQVTRKLVVTAAGRIGMNVAQKLALAVTTDVIVSLSSGARSLTFEAVRGRVDLENLKNNPYFDKEIGPQKHMVRLFATSLAGLGMDKMWRGLSAVGLSNVIDPQTNPLFKLISDYAKNTVNSTVGKVTSTVADLPFEGRAALNRVPSFFTMETLVWGNLQDVAMGRAKGVAVNASSSGLSNRFMIRLSDRNLSSRETSALEGLNR